MQKAGAQKLRRGIERGGGLRRKVVARARTTCTAVHGRTFNCRYSWGRKFLLEPLNLSIRVGDNQSLSVGTTVDDSGARCLRPLSLACTISFPSSSPNRIMSKISPATTPRHTQRSLRHDGWCREAGCQVCMPRHLLCYCLCLLPLSSRAFTSASSTTDQGAAVVGFGPIRLHQQPDQEG